MIKYISKFALLVLVVAIIILIVTGNFFSESPVVIIGQLLSIGFSIWARRTFQKEQFSIHAEPAKGSLLTKGPYKYVRHPMYTSALFLVWISIAGNLSVFTAAIGLIVTAVVATRVVKEEELLSLQYVNYKEYKLTTKAVIPFIY